jgi:hypothetical protein
MKIDSYTFGNKGLEDLADTVKTVVVAALVAEGHLDQHTAEVWCALHGVMLTKKSIFKTLTNFWDKQETFQGGYIQVVRLSDETNKAKAVSPDQ